MRLTWGHFVENLSFSKTRFVSSMKRDSGRWNCWMCWVYCKAVKKRKGIFGAARCLMNNNVKCYSIMKSQRKWISRPASLFLHFVFKYIHTYIYIDIHTHIYILYLQTFPIRCTTGSTMDLDFFNTYMRKQYDNHLKNV